MIPLVRPELPELHELDVFLAKSRESGQWSNFGPCYEQVVETLHGLKQMFCLPVTSGTTAIQVAVQTHFQPGSKILMPDYTHSGTLQAVYAARCFPVLAPVSLETWTLDLNAIRGNPSQFDGMIVVSPFGYPVNFEAYDELAAALRKPLIYDLAGAWGMPVATKNTQCYSLHATKNFSCGEGGLVCFEDEGHFNHARKMTNFFTNLDRTICSPWGGNWKIDELRCAVILAHLAKPERLKKRIDMKKRTLRIYESEFGVERPQYIDDIGAPSLCVLGGLPAKLIERKSHRHGFMAKQYYPLLSAMTALSAVPRIGESAGWFQSCLALPSDVTDDEITYVCRAIHNITENED